MNSYQVFDDGDIVRLRDDLVIQDFLNVKNKRMAKRMLYALINIYNMFNYNYIQTLNTMDETTVYEIINLYTKIYGDAFDNTYVQILDIMDEEYLFVEVTDSDKNLLINRRLFIHISFIDKNTLRTIFIDRNTKKRVRRHDNKLKNNNYGKSKFFHKDKFERK